MKDYRKWIAAVLAVMISAGATGSLAYAKGNEKNAADTAIVTEAEEPAAPAVRKAASGEACKDETVYVLCNADASVRDVIVSDWLKNTQALEAISDISGLTGIVNVRGTEAFTQSGKTLNWNASGDDIYYQGKTDKQPPVNVKMTYYLDGKEIAPADLAGKSGHLRIRWNYESHAGTTVDGQRVTVPFLAVSAAVLDSSNCLNASVKNGRLISDGDRLIAVGAAFPGVNETLRLDETGLSDYQLPEYAELEADVTDFHMNTSVTVVSNELFGKLDTDQLFDVDSLTEQVQALRDGADALCDGTAALYDGIAQLSDGTGDLNAGVEKLLNGSASLKDGAVTLTDGTEKTAAGAGTLSASAEQLTGGIQQAADGADALTAGYDKVTAGAASLTGGLQDAKDGSAQLKAGLVSAETGADTLEKGADALQAGAEQLSAGIAQAGTALSTTVAANQQALAALKALYAQTPSAELAAAIGALEQTTDAQQQIADNMQAEGALGAGAAGLQQGAAQLSGGASQLHGGLTALTDGAERLDGGIAALYDGAEVLGGGLAQLQDGTVSLDGGLHTILDGSTQLSGGAGTLYTSLTELLNGTKKLSGGASELYGGMQSLQMGGTALTDGIAQLKTGANTLNDGMQKFDAEGIAKIAKAADETLPELTDRFRTLRTAAQSYTSFSGKSAEMNGSVRFIYVTDGI